ncbi:dTDP-4-dehydrorhamnose 3,5-epimerase [Limimonas halophila]|uniref:dTDP-4-dehydrorhamnose 3,5-epimerase n=1 Tax=Limimonas halophila TaxID=1082479 RepID=A0A1G7NRU1_9PROT|nr:dTDP-4-dehydrorhamnose 3,5-epimerase [Limimonas halophila]SDF76683.1 dTDP-4-dehydrorhamnose 3,5-epimerase [Limimonas halophila]
MVSVTSLAIPEIKEVVPRIFADSRGFFSEVFNAARLEAHGIEAGFVQENHSLSRTAGTVRGLHFQIPPYAQAKLVRVVRGRLLDVAVDLRSGAPTFGQHVSHTLSTDAWNQLFIPEGFAHGFCTLTDDTEVVYLVTAGYAPEHERGVRWDDPDLAINWPVRGDNAVLSDKDRSYPRLRDLPHFFT